jgi:hypothetical protein
MIVNIPLSFEYRKTTAQWDQSSAHITGWARRTDGTVDGGALVAEITTRGLIHSVKFPRKRLPEGEWDSLWLMAYANADVERLLSVYEPLLLVPWGSVYADPQELNKHSQPADPWQLREEFLRLEPTPKSAIAFLNEWGRWNSEEFVEMTEIVKLQQAIRDAVTAEPDRWFASDYSLPMNWRRSPVYPFFEVLTDKIEVALRMSVTVDLLEKAEFKTCVRPDCGQPFKVASKHDKKFCSRACAHIEAVRRSRRTAISKRVK